MVMSSQWSSGVESEPIIELRRRIDDEDRLETLELPAVRLGSEPLPSFALGSQPDEVTIPRRPAIQQVPPPPALPLPERPVARPPAVVPSIAPVARSLPPPRGSGALPALLGVGLATLGALVGITIVALSVRQAEVHQLDAAAPKVDALLRRPTASAPATVERCKAAGASRRLLSIVPPGATVEARLQSGALAVGVATSGHNAVGITLDPATLQQKDRALLNDPVHVGGVVPLADGSFAVDRYSVRVDAQPEFAVGMTPAGFSRIAPDGSQQVIWPGESTEIITRPTLVHAPGLGYAVGFRRADGSGSVRVGWIDEHGNKMSELGRYAASATRASAPALAVSDQGLVLAFSELDAEGHASVRVGRSALGNLPLKIRVLPDAGDARVPAVAALAGGRTLVAWEDGAVVRGQVLAPDLSAVAPAQAWFDLEGRAESVALTSDGQRATLLLSLPAARARNELWALPLACN